MRRLLRVLLILLYVIGALLTLIILIALGGATWNAIENSRDRKRLKPPGVLIEVDGLRLHLHCSGPQARYGTPTVVLDSGWNMSAFAWTSVQTELQKRVRVCSYDRAGMGWSDADPKLPPRGAQRLANELHALLEYGGAQGPYVLVGHSNGGYLVRAFYDRYPKDVVGAVLVDSSSEYMDERFNGKDWEKEAQEELRVQHARVPLLRAIQWTGFLRWILKRQSRHMPFQLSQDVVDEATFLLNQPKVYPSALAELDGIPETLQQLKKKGGLGELPLIVLTAGNFKPNGAVSPEQAAEWNRLWVHELQPQLAQLSTRGKQIVVDSGHLIPFEKPDAVVKAVDEVLEQAKSIKPRDAF